MKSEEERIEDKLRLLLFMVNLTEEFTPWEKFLMKATLIKLLLRYKVRQFPIQWVRFQLRLKKQ